VARENPRRAGQVHTLDAAGNLALSPVAEFEFVEDEAGDPMVVVRIEQAIARIESVAGRGEALVPALYTDGRCQRREPKIHGHQRDLSPPLLLLVGEGLASSVAENIEWVGQSQLIVAVVCGAGSEAGGVDLKGLRQPFGFAS